MKSDIQASVQNQSSTIDPLLTVEEAAKLLDVAEITLSMWRVSKRKGPAYVKIGRNVRYQLSAIKSFIAKNTVTSEGLEND